jgi:hypothetical protein
MKQDASDTARLASTREVDRWENEGGADRAPHQEDSEPTNQSSEMRHFGGRVTGGRVTKGKKPVTQISLRRSDSTPESPAGT